MLLLIRSLPLSFAVNLVPTEGWKWHFRAFRFQTFLGEHAPKPPYFKGPRHGPLFIQSVILEL